MKVALVVPGGVDRSGSERVIPCLLWLIERLAREHELHVFSLLQDPFPCRYELLGALVHNIGARPRRLRAVAAIVGEHRRSPFDLLHAVWALQPGVVAAVAGRLIRRPVLLHVTGGDLASLPDLRYGALCTARGRRGLRFAASSAARITAPSRFMLDRMEALGLGSGEALPFGVALDRWPARPPRRRDESAPGRLLFVGTLNRVKDPDTLLRAAAALRDRDVRFHLDVVGEDILDGRVQRRAQELRLGEQIQFHGFVPHPELRRLVGRSDLLLVASRHEADPVVALEAAAVGVPAVGTNVGHISDWAAGGGAVAVPVGDHDALARAVSDLLASEERRLSIARSAHRFAVSRDADWTARRLGALYAEITG